MIHHKFTLVDIHRQMKSLDGEISTLRADLGLQAANHANKFDYASRPKIGNKTVRRMKKKVPAEKLETVNESAGEDEASARNVEDQIPISKGIA
jgi:GTP-binding protein EngB required for normal cell division